MKRRYLVQIKSNGLWITVGMYYYRQMAVGHLKSLNCDKRIYDALNLEVMVAYGNRTYAY